MPYPYTTIELSGGSLGREKMLVRCDLARADAAVQVDYCVEDDSEFVDTQYRCADAQHTTSGLIEIAKRLAATALEVAPELICEIKVVGPCRLSRTPKR